MNFFILSSAFVTTNFPMLHVLSCMNPFLVHDGIVTPRIFFYKLIDRLFLIPMLTFGFSSFQIHEVSKVANDALEDEVWQFSAGAGQSLPFNYTASTQRMIRIFPDDVEFGTIIRPFTFSRKPAPLARAINSLFVLQDLNVVISSCHNNEYHIGKLLFSSLSSVCTISDCILRKVRGFLMVISIDCTKLELLGEEPDKSSSNRPKEKLSNCSHKKKGRARNSKRLNPVPKSCGDDVSHKNPLKVYISNFKGGCNHVITDMLPVQNCDLLHI